MNPRGLKNIVLIVIFSLLTVLTAAGRDLYSSSQVYQGDVLTGVLTGVTAGDEVRFLLIGPEGQVRAEAPGIPLRLEDLPGSHRIGLLGMPSHLKPGTYKLRAEAAGREGRSEFEKPVLVRGQTFRTEDIPLNRAMTDLRTDESPEKLEQSRHLWAVLKTFGDGEAVPSESFVSPVENYIMTSWFGDRRTFLYTDGGTAGSVHTGADMAADTGTPIVSPQGGRVVLAENRILTGWSVVIEHLPGVYSIYYHMDRMDVAVGDSVDQGAQIGVVGATGLVTGPHLHWELRVNTIPVEPMKYLSVPLIDKDEIMTMIMDTKDEGG